MKRQNKVIVMAIVVLLAACTGVWMRGVFGPSSTLEHTSKEAVLYQCPMHPQIVKDHPGQCPICHMDLQPVKEEALDEGDGPSVQVHGEPEAGVEGRAPLSINLYQQQLIGVTLETAEVRPVVKTVFTTGRVAYDPALYQAQEEYLSALRALELAAESPVSGAGGRARSVIESARLRLRLLGLTHEQIQALETKKSPERSLLLPEDGEAWVYADIYQQEIPLVQIGQELEITMPARPDRKFSGRVDSVDPVVDRETRTVRVRAKVKDPEGILRPDMFLNVALKINLGKRLSISRHSILDTGRRQIVYVKEGKGRFIPREIKTGVRGEHWVEVVHGLKAGDAVASSGNFLIDAESQLRGAAGDQTFYSSREAAGTEEEPRHFHGGGA